MAGGATRSCLGDVLHLTDCAAAGKVCGSDDFRPGDAQAMANHVRIGVCLLVVSHSGTMQLRLSLSIFPNDDTRVNQLFHRFRGFAALRNAVVNCRRKSCSPANHSIRFNRLSSVGHRRNCNQRQESQRNGDNSRLRKRSESHGILDPVDRLKRIGTQQNPAQ